MRWLEISGPPGSGKSTIADAEWPPRAIRGDSDPYPQEWSEFLDCTERLLVKIRAHPTFARCRSMVTRAFRKMSVVHRTPGGRVYVQTGFAQRGLGIGWRLENTEDIAEYFRLMPVSLGVAFLTADVDVVQKRNVERGKDRSHMVPFMVRPQEIAVDVLRSRGVPVTEISTMCSVAETKARLAEFVASVQR